MPAVREFSRFFCTKVNDNYFKVPSDLHRVSRLNFSTRGHKLETGGIKEAVNTCMISSSLRPGLWFLVAHGEILHIVIKV